MEHRHHLESRLNLPPKMNLSRRSPGNGTPPPSSPWQAPHLVELSLLHETSAGTGGATDMLAGYGPS